jgi:hypothetical protein
MWLARPPPARRPACACRRAADRHFAPAAVIFSAKFSLRIVILVYCYYPSPKSNVELIRDLGVELLRKANDVTIVTPSPSISGFVDIARAGDFRFPDQDDVSEVLTTRWRFHC